MLLEVVKNNSARINIKLVEHKYGLDRKRGACGDKRVHKLLYIFLQQEQTKKTDDESLEKEISMVQASGRGKGH